MFLFNVLLILAVLAPAVATQETAQQLTRAGSFDLSCSAKTAFPLFSPEGERDWIKGWDPQPVYPETITFNRDTVFKQGDAGHEAIWTILDADWQTYRAEYVRLDSASHTAHIVVKVEPLGPERSRVTVTYTVTAFREHAPAIFEAFSEKAYAEKMHHWQALITALLDNRNPRSNEHLHPASEAH